MQETISDKMVCYRKNLLSIIPHYLPGPKNYVFPRSTIFETVILESPKYTACSVVQVLPCTSSEILNIILSASEFQFLVYKMVIKNRSTS